MQKVNITTHKSNVYHIWGCPYLKNADKNHFQILSDYAVKSGRYRPCKYCGYSKDLPFKAQADKLSRYCEENNYQYQLEKENLLNDQEFSELWVQQRSRKYGSRRIRQELRVKGVPESTAEKALSSVSDEEMLESATSLAVKAWSRAKPGDDPRKTRQRIISSLVRKGFDWDLARQASDTAESETIF